MDTYLATLHLHESANIVWADADERITKIITEAFEKHYGDEIPAECSVDVQETLNEKSQIFTIMTSIHVPVEVDEDDFLPKISGKAGKLFGEIFDGVLNPEAISENWISIRPLPDAPSAAVRAAAPAPAAIEEPGMA